MMRVKVVKVLGLIFAFLLTGCVVRTYQKHNARVDQDLSGGNRGYLQGDVPPGEVKERKKTRTINVVEVELHPPIKFERLPDQGGEAEKPIVKSDKAIEETQDKTTGNRGYFMQKDIAETKEVKESVFRMEKYTVKKGDTLQKISRHFYGTTKKWNKIYEANQDKLKAANKIYPGEVLDIPVEPLEEMQKKIK